MPTMTIRKPSSSTSAPSLSKMRAVSNRQREVLQSYNNKHKGKRGFLIGGGYSLRLLQKEDFDFHSLEKEIVVGVNKAYKLLTPSYLVFGDAAFWKEFHNEIRGLSCIKFAPEDVIRKSPDASFLLLRRGTSYKEVLPVGLDFPVSFINNSGVAALRIMYALGCNPIYLLGIDLMESSTGETHFHTDYKKLGRDVPIRRYKQFQVEFSRTLTALKMKNCSVFSCSPHSLLNTIIPYIPITSLF